MADSKVSELTAATSIGGSDVFYLVQNNTSKKVTAATLFSNLANVTVGGNINIGGTPQSLGAPGIISLTTPITHLSVDASGGTLQLPVGTNGQIKLITLISSSGGTYTINSENVANSANITFNNVGDTALLVYSNNKWNSIGQANDNFVIQVNGKTGTVTLSTLDIAESGNLYFTNSRAVSSLTGGSGISIASNGLITSNVSSGLTASSIATLTNKTYDVSVGSNNILSIQGQSITSYSGSGQVVLLQQSPTINILNVSDSNLNLDGGSGSFYWTGPSGVLQPGNFKAGLYSSTLNSPDSLFTFGTSGANTMSVAVEGSLFVGTGLPSNHSGITTAYPGWLVVQSGAKFGAGINTLGYLMFDNADNGYIQFQDGTVKTSKTYNRETITDTNKSYASGGANATVWTASSADVIAAKVTVRAQQDYNFNTELFSVLVAKDGIHVNFNISERMSSNVSYPASSITAGIDGSNKLFVKHQDAYGFGNAYVVDVKEFLKTY